MTDVKVTSLVCFTFNWKTASRHHRALKVMFLLESQRLSLPVIEKPYEAFNDNRMSQNLHVLYEENPLFKRLFARNLR